MESMYRNNETNAKTHTHKKKALAGRKLQIAEKFSNETNNKYVKECLTSVYYSDCIVRVDVAKMSF